MVISFAKRKLANVFSKEHELTKVFGKRMAGAIMRRMAVLQAAPNLGLIPVDKPERCHQLDGDRKGQFAVDLIQPRRLVFEPDHDPVPKLTDGGVDKSQVTAIKILDVVDYH